MTHHGQDYPAKGAWLLDNALRRWIQPPGELADKLAITGEQTVVDFGCGPGYFTVELAKRAGKVVAVDLQLDMLAKARRKTESAGVGNVEFLQSNGKSIALPDASVDLILLVTVFHEVGDPPAVLREFGRILNPNGKLAIVEVTKKSGLIALAPIQNPLALQSEVESADFILQSMQPYRSYTIMTFTKKGNIKL